MSPENRNSTVQQQQVNRTTTRSSTITAALLLLCAAVHLNGYKLLPLYEASVCQSHFRLFFVVCLVWVPRCSQSLISSLLTLPHVSPTTALKVLKKTHESVSTAVRGNTLYVRYRSSSKYFLLLRHAFCCRYRATGFRRQHPQNLAQQ